MHLPASPSIPVMGTEAAAPAVGHPGNGGAAAGLETGHIPRSSWGLECRTPRGPGSAWRAWCPCFSESGAQNPNPPPAKASPEVTPPVLHTSASMKGVPRPSCPGDAAKRQVWAGLEPKSPCLPAPGGQVSVLWGRGLNREALTHGPCAPVATLDRVPGWAMGTGKL